MQRGYPKVYPLGLGGFPHERHRGYRLKVPSGRWRIRAVQEQMNESALLQI